MMGSSVGGPFDLVCRTYYASTSLGQGEGANDRRCHLVVVGSSSDRFRLCAPLFD
jgi:hypothetical protein